LIKESIYNLAPSYIQNIFCSIHGIQLKSQRYNSFFYKYLEQLQASEKLTCEEILSYKEARLEEMLHICFNDVSYYKGKLNKAGLSIKNFKSLADLDKFPVLEKEEMRTHWKEMVNSAYNGKLIYSHTSGSTGKALDYFLTKESISNQWAVWWRFRERFGIKLFDKHLNFTGKLIIPINQKSPPFWRINYPLNQWLVNMQHISLQKVSAIAKMIESEKFRYFSGYPSIISSFCFLVKELNITIRNHPEIVFTGAEKLFDHQKEIIQEVLKCKVTDHYGFSEGAGNASKCTYDLYHEDFEFGHLECYNGYRTPEGTTGEILATGFSNLGMPFLRYRVGDTATWSDKDCDCGLHSTVLTNIEGRSEDYVLTPEGTKILRFDYIFKDTSSIRECQIVQKELNSIIIRIVKRDNYKIEIETFLRNMVKQWISPRLTVNFEYINEIPRTASGKFRAVISEIQ
jgi:phenylacetate-CoA ligase